MVVYKVFFKNYKLKRGELLGMLAERRGDLRGLTQIESGLRWAKFTFSHMVKDKNAMFVVPNELGIRDDARQLVGKGVYTREELPGITGLLDREALEQRKN